MVWLLTWLLFLQRLMHTLCSVSQFTAVTTSFHYYFVFRLQSCFFSHTAFSSGAHSLRPTAPSLFRLLVFGPSEVLKTQHKYANRTSNLSLSAYCAHLLTALGKHFPIDRKTKDVISLACQFDKWILKIRILCLLSTMQRGKGWALQSFNLLKVYWENGHC